MEPTLIWARVSWSRKCVHWRSDCSSATWRPKQRGRCSPSRPADPHYLYQVGMLAPRSWGSWAGLASHQMQHSGKQASCLQHSRADLVDEGDNVSQPLECKHRRADPAPHLRYGGMSDTKMSCPHCLWQVGDLALPLNQCSFAVSGPCTLPEQPTIALPGGLCVCGQDPRTWRQENGTYPLLLTA